MYFKCVPTPIKLITLFTTYYFPICQRTSLETRSTQYLVLRLEFNRTADNLDSNHHTPSRVISIISKKELIIFPFVVEDIGVEPMTLCVQGRCSSQLS